MDKKKILIICLILCVICTLSAASAADAVADNTNKTLAISEGDVADANDDMSSLSVSDDSDVLKSGGGTFTELNAIINNPNLGDNPTITLNQNYTYVSADGNLKKGINFTKGMTIDGNGHTIDGNNLARILSIGNDGHQLSGTEGPVVLKNIVFANAYSNEGDQNRGFGAVEFNGKDNLASSLLIENCTFINNNAKVAAAISLARSYDNLVNITNCTFVGNKATGIGGGAIRIRNDVRNLKISDTLFKNNEAPSDGGALHIASGGEGTLIDNCTFISNTVGGNGGAIYNEKKIIINGCNFTGHSAYRGGALSISGKNTVVNNSYFASNHASYDTNAHGGGAIEINSAGENVIVDHCSFTNNRAKGHGGALSSQNLKNLTINHSNFTSNYAGSGGALFFENPIGIRMFNVTFKSNYVTGQFGGAIHFNSKSSDVNLTNCSFLSNFASTSNNGRGGAIRLDGDQDGFKHFYFINITFKDNHAKDEGGAFSHNQRGVDFHFINCTFINCTTLMRTSAWGGGMYFNAYNSELKNITFINCSSQNGGSLSIKWSTGTTFENITIINSTAYSAGGAVMIWDSSSVFANATIINSTCTNGYGGAIYWGSNQGSNPSKGVLSNIKIINSTAKTTGGAIHWSSVYGTISNITIINASASNGGGIYISSSDNQLSDFRFINSTATADGGALYIAADYQNMKNFTFENSNATRNGGAVYVGNCIYIYFYDSTFNNSHAYNGGGLYYTGSIGSLLWLHNSTFINNTVSHNGGAIYYVVDDDVDNLIVYRDYDNFDGRGDNSTGRTTVTLVDADGSTYAKRIDDCYFKDNEDYLLNISALPDENTLMAIVNVSSPNDPNRYSYMLVVNVTKDNQLVTQLILNTTANYTAYFNTNYKKFIMNLRNNLTKLTDYNVTVGFKDSNYLYKEAKASFKTRDVVEKGDFHILQELIINHYSEGVLDLTRSYEFTAKEDYANIQIPDDWCMNITKTITINGNGFTINALGYTRIFNITAANVVLNNIKFVNGNASGIYNNAIVNPGKTEAYGDGIDKGGAIFWAGQYGLINNSIVSDNAAEYGAGIFFNSTASFCKVANSTFSENRADKNGGAIECNATKMNLTNTIFEHNFAENGSALCREANATGGFGFNNTFISNHAYCAGAALAWMKAENISISNYTFIDNTADVSGGAIYVGEDSTNCTVAYSYFRGNNITSSVNGHGGAIEWYADVGRVINSTFINNNAPTGGAIYVGGASGHINITQSGFLRNHAVLVGGAIDLVASSVTVNNTYFRENTASNGGAIFVGGTGENNFINASFFTNNNATNGRGGAINWNASAGQIFDTNFTRNNANYGGAIYIGGSSDNSQIVNVNFVENNAVYNGGAIDWNATGGKLYNTTFTSNYAGEYGAALCRESGATGGGGKNNTFISNHAGIAGAALGWINVEKITIVKYTFIDNTANCSGGAIYIGPGSNNCTIINSTFRGNNVTNATGGHGGAVDVVADNATVINSTFTNNNAFYGGALFVGSASGHTVITNDTFRKNTANVDGGAVYLLASSVNVTKSKFYSNKAVNGSALYVGGTGENNTVYKSVFENNNATGYGAGIYWRASAGAISYSNFTGNVADYGGGIYLNGISRNSNITNVRFIKNNATYNGGAIDCNSTNMGLNNTYFESNYAGEYGAALCREADATGGHGKNNTFVKNHAGISGAALAWLNVENIHINNYTFTNNTADHSGGAIYISRGSDNCVIFNSTFKGNHLTNMTVLHNGGAIDCLADNLTVNMSSFEDNGAYVGGAIYVGTGSSQAHILKSNFTSNYAYGDGGAIGLKADNLIINGSRFTSNTAAGSGGAVNVGGSGEANKIHYSVFEENKAGTHGGAVNWLAQAGEIMHSNFTKNTAEYGGGVYLNGVSSKSKISNVIFANNTASENGGAIDCNAREMNLTNTKFISNYAKYGAALCRESGATGGFGGNNTFDKNHAYVSGAALAWLSVDNIKINNYTFTNNTADFSGGAIFVNVTSNNCQVYNSTFKDNFVTNAIEGRGGAIDWLGNNGTVKNSTFEKCISVNGGAMYVGSQSDNMTVKNVTFTECSSLTDGGAIVITGDDASITNSTFISCSGKDNGGAIAGFNSNNGNISDCNFKYNTVGIRISPQGVYYGEGGAIYWENSTNLRVSNSKFESNEAHLSGGSISADNCNDSVIFNITTHDETAFRNGGSVAWINSNNVTIANSTFNDTGANYMGGTIYFENINATVKHTLVNYTWASWNRGGGIYVDGNVNITNVTFNDTHVDEDNASAIYFNSGVSRVENSTFTNSYNSIGIARGANVTLTRNKLIADDPNKDTVKYIVENTTEAASRVKYAVWNEGDLYLDKNSFDYVIFNNGTIWTKTTTRMLDNGTYNVTWNETFVFFANIVDDNQNTIISVRSLNTTNDVFTDAKNHYILPYNADGIQCIYQGVFHLTALDDGLKQNEVFNGTLNVKMPVDVELDIQQPTTGSFEITATLTPKVTSNYTINGEKVFFKIGNREFNVTIANCPNNWDRVIVTTSVNDLSVGIQSLTATFNGNVVHLGSNDTKSENVLLRDSWIKMVIASINYGESTTAIITTNSNGTVRLNFHGRDEFIEVAMTRGADGNYTGSVQITPENYTTTGMHDAGIVVEANEYYKANTNISSFEVRKLNTTVTAVPLNPIEVGDKQVITVTVNENYQALNASGFVNITVNGETHFKQLDSKGKATINIYELPKDSYQNIKVEYLGDDYFNGNSTLVSFSVEGDDDYEITVIVDNITYGQNATIYISLPTSVTQNLTVFVNNTKIENVTVNNGLAKVTVPDLPAGNYIINVTYPGDDTFAPNCKNGTKLNVAASSDWALNLTVEAHQYGQNTIFTVNVPKNVAVKVVNLTIDGKYHAVAINNNGIGTLTLNNLSGGFHTAVANYTGDANYTSKTNQTNFYVAQAPSQVNLTQNGKTVEAKVTENATGTVTFYVNGRNETKPVDANGFARWENVLEIGNNTVVAVYNGDKNFTVSQNSTADFTVPKYDNAKVNVSAVNVTYGNASEITVRVPAAQTGYVNIVINGTDINVTLAINASGVAKFNATGLDVGVYRINVTYLGDKLYDVKENFTLFNITKANLTAEAVVQNATVRGNVSFVVDVNSDFKGRVNITKDGVSYFDDDFKSLIVLDKLPAGIYDANMTFYGDDNYNNKTVPVRFEVSKVDPEIIVTIQDVTYPDNATAEIHVNDNANGTVRIVVDGKDITRTITNGALDVEIEGLSGGVKEATVTFTCSDNYYNDGEVKVKFEVRKAPSQVNLTQSDKTVIAEVTENATGTVTFYVNGRNETKPVDANGFARWENVLEIGNNTVVAVYNGDKNFTVSQNSTADFTVPKYDNAKVNVSAVNVTYGNASEITVRVPAAQTGYVNIVINGTDINVTLALNASGVAKFNATGLDVGVYRINVTYLGDKLYDIKENYTYFNITKADLNPTVYGLNVTVKENSGFVIDVNDDFKGKVNITIGGVSYYDGDVDALIPIRNIAEADIYTASVKFYGDDNYNNKTVNVQFNVSRVVAIINVTIDDKTYPDKVIALINMSDYANGTVNITVDGKVFNGTVENGNARIEMECLSAGAKVELINFTATDKFHFNATAVSKSVVEKAPSQVNITREDNSVIAKVTANATGTVTFYVNGKANTTAIDANGIARWDNVLEVGNNSVVVVYNGDKNFTMSVNSTADFTVSKYANATVNVTATTVTYGNDSVITVKVPKDQTGYVRITVNGTDINVTAEIINGIATVNATGLDVAKYIVNVTYLGNEIYGIKENSTDFSITKANLTASVIAQNVTVEENTSFIITVLNDFNGTVKIEVDGKTYEGDVKTLIEMDKLLAGPKEATVTFANDNNYNVRIIKAGFTVTAVKPTINVTITDAKYPNDTTAIVKVSGGASGTVNITIGDKTFNRTITGGEVEIPITGLDAGVKEAVINFYSNDHYNGDVNTTYKFVINKTESHIKINVTPNGLSAGDDAVINISVSCTGDVVFYIDGVKSSKGLEDSRIILNKNDFAAGKHTVVVYYPGDNNYLSSSDSYTFTVGQREAEVNVTVEGTPYRQAAQITVKTPQAQTGYVTITVNNENYTKKLEKGVAVFSVTGLDAGRYDVDVTYEGDENYTARENSTSFNVTSIELNPIVTGVNVTKNINTTFIVDVPDDFKGKVNITVDGVKYSGDADTIIRMAKLQAGDKVATAEFYGDSNYKDVKLENIKFTVSKADEVMVVTEIVENSTVIITLPENATGNVTVILPDGSNTTVNVTNGTAVVKIENQTPGMQNITVIYSGDENYTNVTISTNITVPKYDSGIDVTVSKVKEGETATVTVTVPKNATGNVTVTIDGKKYTTDNIVEGVATITTGNLTAGNKTVVVEYSGDGNYSANYTISNFTVEAGKADTKPVVIDQGNGTVVVVVGDNATGNVTVKVGDNVYTANVTNGTAIVNVDNETPGIHEIEVVYSGDDNHGNSTVNSTVSVPKYDSKINATVVDLGNGTVVVTVEVPENATGNVTVNVGGNESVKEIKDGQVIITVDNVSAGNHTVAVEYSGDDNFAGNYTISNVTVSGGKADTEPVVIDYGNGTVVVVVGDNATGNVTVKVGDNVYTANVTNGTAVITLTNETPGTHEIEVIYSGDDNHGNSTVNSTVSVPKYDSDINMTVVDLGNGTVVVTVEVPENATGNVTVNIGGTEHVEVIKDSPVVITVDDVGAGNHTVVVEYSGDGNYSANYIISNVTVAGKVDTEPIIIDYGNGTVVVVVGDNATGNVTVKVGDNVYTANVTNGTATITLTNETPGTHEIEVIYSGDDNHGNSTVNSTVTVPKYDSDINMTVVDLGNGTVVVTVEVPENATGNVTVNIGGTEHVVVIKDTPVVVTVDNVGAGNHTVVVEYSGDGNYSANYTISNVTVAGGKADSEPIIIDYGNGTVVVVVGDNATGNVTVKVGDNVYTANVTNGTATITLTNETPGTHEIEVIYSGDDTHGNASVNASVSIDKYETPISINVASISVGDNATVTVNVPKDAKGTITIEIDGKTYTEEIINGIAKFEVEKLTAGEKSVFATYEGDSNYTGNFTSAQFNVTKVDSKLNVEIKDVKVGENVTVTVHVPNDATGQVLIDINGVGYYLNVSGGSGSAEIPYLPNGQYDVNLTYTGDDKYLPVSNKTAVKVSKLESFVIPIAYNIVLGENENIRLIVPEDATGNVTVVIDGDEYSFSLQDGALGVSYTEGEKYDVAVSGGKGEIIISGLPSGEYVVSVRYNGDNKYLPSLNSTMFTVSQKETPIEIIDLGNGTVKVILPDNATGNLIISDGNNTYTAKVTDGEAIINLENTTPGEHDLIVKYVGESGQSSNTIKFNVEIPKYDAPISVEVSDISVGQTETVTVTVPDNATGKVTIEINGRNYTEDVKNGKAVFNVEGLAFGQKTVAVTYWGDDNYRDNYTTGQFTVSKVPSTVKATSADITVGKDEVITATVPGDATGRVLVDIGGVGYYGNVINGKAKIVIPELPSGKYTAKVTYEGDDKYLPSTTSASFKVSKSKAPISAGADDILEGEDAVVVVNVPKDATGTVTITVDGKQYVETVKNGRAVFTVPGLTKGDYDIDASYSGDRKYDANDTLTDIEVYFNETPDHHGGAAVRAGVSLSEYATGNPVMIALLMILTMGSVQIRRFKK